VKLIGHEELRHTLSHDVPPVVLIEGPEGIGKKLVAREAAEHLAPPTSRVEIGRTLCTKDLNDQKHEHERSCEMTTARVARAIVDSCRVRGAKGKVVVFDAGICTVDAANILLKLLEEPPPKVHFIMHASIPPLPTITSRSLRLRASPLSDEETKAVLASRGVDNEHAERAAQYAAGRPGVGIRAANMIKHRGTALQLLRAARENDRALMSNATQAFLPTSEEERAEARRYGHHAGARYALAAYIAAIQEVRLHRYVLFDRVEVEWMESLPTTVLDAAIRTMAHPAATAHVAARVATEILAAANTERRT
jgi:hypothetical protein